METFNSGGEIVWRPSPELIAQSNLQHFMQAHGLGSIEELQERSTTDLDWFWNAVIQDLGIRFRQPYSRVLDCSRGIAWPEWCVGGVMNIVDNCLDKYAGTPTDSKLAIRWEGEEGSILAEPPKASERTPLPSPLLGGEGDAPGEAGL